jgi:hypothetical protein
MLTWSSAGVTLDNVQSSGKTRVTKQSIIYKPIHLFNLI